MLCLMPSADSFPGPDNVWTERSVPRLLLRWCTAASRYILLEMINLLSFSFVTPLSPVLVYPTLASGTNASI